MGRGRYYNWWRRAGETAEALFYANGWAARAAHALGLQGRLHIDRRDVTVPLSAPSAEPLRVAFASDFHAGPLTDPRLLDAMQQAIAAFAPHVILLGGGFAASQTCHRIGRAFAGTAGTGRQVWCVRQSRSLGG